MILRDIARRARAGAIWKPSHTRLLWAHVQDRNRNQRLGYSDSDHLLAAVAWLEHAQDVTTNGGVSGRYLLSGGWASAYPETTGYIIPTFLDLARCTGVSRFHARASRAAEFLIGVQLPEGAFPAGEIADNPMQPSVFNTAQIIHGLVTWHKATRDEQSLTSAVRAGDWLLSIQDTDGAWRRHAYLDVPVTYSAHASCWLAELGCHLGEERFLKAASRHVDWVLQHRDPVTGWIDNWGFSAEDHAVRRSATHTVAYTIWGLLTSGELLSREDAVGAARQAALRVARRLELSSWLPGVLNHKWQGESDYACVTGNLQMALIWLRLYMWDRDERFLSAALKSIDLAKAAQFMTSRNPGIQGGIPGSHPVWGGDISMAIPNWAAKYFIDALLAKKSVLDGLEQRPKQRWRIPSDVPVRLPESATEVTQKLTTVFYAAPSSTKVAAFVEAWRSWGFRPEYVVLEATPKRCVRRLRARVRDEGPTWFWRELLRRIRATSGPSASLPDAVSYCRKHNIPVVRVTKLDSPEALEILSILQPDVAIHAGAGILRASTLGVPRIGTLNAHMGFLPFYRGMNVAEWAMFNMDPVGCTVHWIDPGVDTGAIICARQVDASGCRSIAELRERVDEAQIGLLGEVLRWILQTGTAPVSRRQSADEGVQFFRMHPELLAVIEREMNCAAQPTCAPPSAVS